METVSLEPAALYEAFQCPCCGDDTGSCTCGIAEERRAFIDEHVVARAKEVPIETLSDDRPVLSVASSLVSLGTIPIDGGVVTTGFTLQDTGESDLTITELQTSCGCTMAVLEMDDGTSPAFGANSAENPDGWSAVLAT